MPEVIFEYGFYLPNGEFIANDHGDGHAKNAYRFCQQYSALEKFITNNSNGNADDLLLMGGCAAVAGSGGKRCLRIAQDNTNPFMKKLVKAYQDEGFQIHKFWQIDKNFAGILNNVMNHEYAKRIITDDGFFSNVHTDLLGGIKIDV